MQSVISKIVAMLFLAALAVTATASCPKEYKFSDEVSESYTLSPQGRIELQNINGDVHISAWDADSVQVRAVKRAYAQADLEKARIQIDAKADFIRIQTVYSKTHAWNCEHNDQANVEYTILVPRTARLSRVELVNGNLSIADVSGGVKASSVNGIVSVSGLGGRADLSTVNGKLEAVFDHIGGSNIQLMSMNGPLMVTLPSDVDAELQASTVKGELDNDFRIPVERHDFPGHELRAELGSGRAKILLKNVNGSVSIRRASDGKPLSPVRVTPGEGF